MHERGVVRFVNARRVARFRASDKYTLFRVDGEEHLVVRDSLEERSKSASPRSASCACTARSSSARTPSSPSRTSPAGASLELLDGQHVAVSRRYLASVVKRALGVT